jgi:hypothetical protein
MEQGGKAATLKRVTAAPQVAAGTWLQAGGGTTVCFDLPRGRSVLELVS